MLKPQHSLQSVVTDLVNGLKAGTIQLRDDGDAAVPEGEPLVAESEQVQDSGVEIVERVDIAVEFPASRTKE